MKEENVNNRTELSEEKLEDISGGRTETTIKPKESDTWISYNPNSNLDPNQFIIKP